MAPFSIPTPSIIPLRLPIFGGPKSFDTKTKIQIFCETYLEHEIYYTIDGTKPQPYAGIVQGNRTIKYTSPFCLPAGKITIKAMAINSVVHTMSSSVVTKSFDVLKMESGDDEPLKNKKFKDIKTKKNSINCENNKFSKDKQQEENLPDLSDERLGCESIQEIESHTNCLEEAFIGSTDFELESHENSDEDTNCFPVNKNSLDINDNHKLSETVSCDEENSSYENDSVFEAVEKLTLETDKNVNRTNAGLSDSGTSVGTQFCCLKCDLTLQQCSNCNKMNAVSSKFCIGCGEQLLLMCYSCKEWNLVIATFCQFCGKKLGNRMNPYLKLNQLDQSVMVKPKSANVSTQVLPITAHKSTQTIHVRTSRRSSSSSRRMPPISPGRGYWHQQLDYICNHLKSHAYNNVEFRNEISEPTLCDLKSARIIKEDSNIVVSLSFTPFVPDKKTFPTSEDIQFQDRRLENS